MVISLIFSILGQNQYTVISSSHSSLRSPKISEHNACFTFQYFANFLRDDIDTSVAVFIRVITNSRWLQLWTESLEKGRGKWRTVKVLLDNENGLDQVNRLFVKICFEYISNGKLIKRNLNRHSSEWIISGVCETCTQPHSAGLLCYFLLQSINDVRKWPLSFYSYVQNWQISQVKRVILVYMDIPYISSCCYTGCLKKKALRKFNRLSCIINVAKLFNFYIGRKNSYLAYQ
jgi:hypothetical protein